MGGSGAPSSSTSTVIAPGLPNPYSSQFGALNDLPYGPKAKKNITVKDRQRDMQTRISVKLDNSELADIPDGHRLKNSVFPRSHYPRQTACSGHDDGSDDEQIHRKTHVQIDLEDGFSEEFPIPKLRPSKRERERDLNDFGCHMMWGTNGRHFDDRNLFLQQASKFLTSLHRHYTAADQPV